MPVTAAAAAAARRDAPAAAAAAVSPLALLYHQHRVYRAELIAGQRFAELARGADHAAYTAACKAACRAGTDAFGVLDSVVLRGVPVRTPRGLALLNDVLHELVLHFALADAGDRRAA